MLVGSVVNTHPDLFKAAIAHVPFVDVLNTMLDERLPLTVGEFKEWGNPTDDRRFFEYIRSYSPYDNVKRQRYPHILVTASIADPRVGYWEPAKWVARLRRSKTDSNLVILKTSMHAGHGGATSVDEYLTEVAEEIVFVLHVLGRLDH
jgi:oligopeptidase B